MSPAKVKATSRSQPPGIANEVRWDKVVNAAGTVFAEKGYRAATLQDVASRLGMNKASLYYYIESKEDLLFEIMTRAHEQGISYVTEDEATSKLDAPIRLASLIDRWIHGVDSRQASVHAQEYDFRYLSGERQREIRAMRRRINGVVEQIILAGMRDGSFDKDIDPYMATSTLFRVLNTARLWYRPGGRITSQDVVDWFSRLFLAGLAPEIATLPAYSGSGGPLD